MMSEAGGAVMVGVDGSEPGYRAVEWAAAEAFRRGVALRVLHCASGEPPASLTDRAEERARRQAAPVVAEALDRARAITGGAGVVTVQAPLAAESPARKLVVEAHYASLLVLGDRGRGGAVSTLLLGSTAGYAAAQASCPVMVVRAGAATQPGAPVLVGVDASAAAQPVLECAFSWAAARNVGVVALHAWQRLGRMPASPRGRATVGEEQHEAARGKLAEALRPWQDLCSQVPVEHRVVEGSPAGALATASQQGVEAVVVGSRGLAARAGMVMGSVSQSVLRHTHRPVVIAR